MSHSEMLHVRVDARSSGIDGCQPGACDGQNPADVGEERDPPGASRRRPEHALAKPPSR